ncbi:MAG: hypothetical protein E6G26_09240 [Actinobacteria bacterium]|nr:MAG: hypothetical protein E6G26_09240 [Actinomycetota bacterium]
MTTAHDGEAAELVRVSTADELGAAGKRHARLRDRDQRVLRRIEAVIAVARPDEARLLQLPRPVEVVH